MTEGKADRMRQVCTYAIAEGIWLGVYTLMQLLQHTQLYPSYTQSYSSLYRACHKRESNHNLLFKKLLPELKLVCCHGCLYVLSVQQNASTQGTKEGIQ